MKALEFIRGLPEINIRALERAAGIPYTALHRAVKGERGLPTKHEARLEEALKPYGFK